MRALVVYDSVYGNTEEIAKAIGGAISGGEVRVLRAGEVGPPELENISLLVVGAPTQGGRATPAIKDFLERVTKAEINGLDVAAFDTRYSAKAAKIFGYAAGKIASSLKKKGAHLIVDPEGFFVEGVQGPLKEGELERAAAWGKGLSPE
ncbi:MAG: flavodoxin family protein [Dehalococcoidales bacterium]|nr:flavodoxin family protein [Dehalococcoidales bacterium]